MKVTQMPPVHAANLVVNSGNTAYGVDVIEPLETTFIEILIKVLDVFFFNIMYLKMFFAKCQPLCSKPNPLIHKIWKQFCKCIFKLILQIDILSTSCEIGLQ